MKKSVGLAWTSVDEWLPGGVVSEAETEVPLPVETKDKSKIENTYYSGLHLHVSQDHAVQPEPPSTQLRAGFGKLRTGYT